MRDTPPVENVAIVHDIKAPASAPYEALFPNLDKFSPTALRKGSLGRRRLLRALLVLGSAAVVIAAIIVLPTLLR